MRCFALSVALSLSVIAVRATPTFNVTLSSENGGADTRLTWNYSGSLSYSPTAAFTNINIVAMAFGSGNTSNFAETVSGTTGAAFNGNLASVTGLSTGLFLTNTTTSQTQEVQELKFFYDTDTSSAFVVFWFPNGVEADGNEVLVLSGPTTGSILTGLAYENFNAGSWTLSQQIRNFDGILTVGGAPIPEPSTYGLILGGLALAGAALRRRRKV
jgi:hypothetical protein